MLKFLKLIWCWIDHIPYHAIYKTVGYSNRTSKRFYKCIKCGREWSKG